MNEYTLKKLEEMTNLRISIPCSSSGMADNLINNITVDPNLFLGVHVKKVGVPCEVTFYVDFSSNSIRTVAAITITNSYNIGYGGTGPHTLFDHLCKLKFVTSENEEDIKKKIFSPGTNEFLIV